MTEQPTKESSYEAQAAEWFLLMESDTLPTPLQLEAFLLWLKDPEAEIAYTHCENIWHLSASLAKDPDILTSRAKPLSLWLRVKQGWQQVNVTLRYGLPLVSLSVVVLLIMSRVLLFDQGTTDLYQTATGQQKTIILADGSQITLNTSSEVHVSYNRKFRKVVLARGEVLFDVAKDKHRPFSVIAGNGEITALGTIFNVKKFADQHIVEVALLEGEVQVIANIKDDNNKALHINSLLKDNQLTSYSVNSVAAITAIHDSEKLLQWKEGRLSFTNATLANVIEQVNRYTINKLIIEDLLLQSEKIDAYFIIGDTPSLLAALKEAFNISWLNRKDGILLYRDGPANQAL